MLLVDGAIPSLLRLVAQVGDDDDNGARADDGGVIDDAGRLCEEPKRYTKQ